MFTTEAKTLHTALTQAKRAADTRKACPLLQRVRFDAESCTLRCSTTDLDMYLSAEIPGTLDGKPFACTVDLVDLLAVLRGVEGLVEIAHAPGTLAVAGCTLPADAVEDYPQRPVPQAPQSTDACTWGELADALRRVEYAVARNTKRASFCGVCVRGDALVATDGHRLAISLIPGFAGPGLVLPHKAVKLLAACVKANRSTTLQLLWGLDEMRVCADTWELWIRPIPERFPNFAKVIPHADDWELSFRVSVAALRAAAERAGAVASAETHAIRLQVGAGELAVSASTAEKGSAEAAVPTQHTGEGVFGLNYRYLLAALKNIQSPEVLIEVIDGESPVQLTDPAQPAYTQIIMPVQL